MTIAIKRGNGDLIWFDAVTAFDRQFSGTISKHPLETGAVITDHTTIDNEVIALSGVLSDFDFNLYRPVINPQDAFQLGLINKQFVNNTPVTSFEGTDGVLFNNILIEDAPGFARNLPESVGQFFGTNTPRVSLDPRTPRKVKPADSVRADLIFMFQEREQFTILSFVDETLKETLTNCVMNSLVFREDADTGDVVFPVMSIERVNYATSTSVRVQTRVASAIEKQSTPQQNQGHQSPTSVNVEDTELNAKGPTTNSKRTSMLLEGQRAAIR